jgi:hypothetical protein
MTTWLSAHENNSESKLWTSIYGLYENSGYVILYMTVLCQNNRRADAFADDTSASFARQADNLQRVKNILIEFGRISGLETNIEKQR